MLKFGFLVALLTLTALPFAIPFSPPRVRRLRRNHFPLAGVLVLITAAVVVLWQLHPVAWLTLPPLRGPAAATGYLHETAFWLQGALGLGVLLALGWLTLRLFLLELPRRALLVVLGLSLVWFAVYAALPFHLSAPDFDDFFVLTRFDGWMAEQDNNKPYFTFYDFAFRLADGFLPPVLEEDRFFRFATNGWAFVLYQVNLFLLSWRLVVRRLSRGRRWAPVTAALLLTTLNAAAVVLSHSLFYSLLGGALLVAMFQFVEEVRAERLCVKRPIGALLGVLALGLILQGASYNQFSAMWVAVFAHVVVALWWLRAPLWANAAGIATTALGVWSFLKWQVPEITEVSGDPERSAVLMGLVVAVSLSFAVGLLVVWRQGVVARARRREAPGFVTALVVLGYGTVTLALFLVPNGPPIGLPIPAIPTDDWAFATNHARYSTFFWPFFVAAVVWLVSRMSTGGLRGAAALAVPLALLFAWNAGYFWGFYRSELSYQANMRPIVELQHLAAEHEIDRFCYLPIPRDYGDHLLVKAALPEAAVQSVCEGRHFVSRPGWLALSQKPVQAANNDWPLALPVDLEQGIGYREGWEVLLFETEKIDTGAADLWCAAYDRHQNPDDFENESGQDGRNISKEPTAEGQDE